MEPNWNKCSEIMPPNNNEPIIAKADKEKYQVGTGRMLRALFLHVRNHKTRVDPTWQRTAYSDELWQSVKPK